MSNTSQTVYQKGYYGLICNEKIIHYDWGKPEENIKKRLKYLDTDTGFTTLSGRLQLTKPFSVMVLLHSMAKLSSLENGCFLVVFFCIYQNRRLVLRRNFNLIIIYIRNVIVNCPIRLSKSILIMLLFFTWFLQGFFKFYYFANCFGVHSHLKTVRYVLLSILLVYTPVEDMARSN